MNVIKNIFQNKKGKMSISLFLREFDAEESTKHVYGHHLSYIQEYLNDEGIALSKVNLTAYDDFLSSHDWSNASQRLNLSAFKAYLKWEGDGHSLQEFRIPRRQAKPQRFLRPDQLELLLEACGTCHKIMAVRNRAMILTLWDTLLRSSEICRIQQYHLDLSLSNLRVDTKATNGKGRTWETKVFSDRTATAIKEYLEVRQHYSLVGDPYLFVSMTGTKLTKGGFQCVFKRLRKHVGFQVSPHDFRRGGAAHAVERGVPDRLVMQQGGWKTHSVFQRYTEGAKLSAYANLLWDNTNGRSPEP